MTWLFLLLALQAFAGPVNPGCGQTSALAAQTAELNQYLAALDGKKLTGKDGKTYRVLTTSIDRSEEKLNSAVFAGTPDAMMVGKKPVSWKTRPHNVEIVDEHGAIVGFLYFRNEGIKIKLDVAQMRSSYQALGLSTQVLEAKLFAAGTRLRLYSGNDSTNDYLDAIVDPLLSAPEYQRIVAAGGKAAGDRYLSAEVAKKLGSAKPDEGGAWPRLLRKAGWKKLTVEVDRVEDVISTTHFMIEVEN